MAERRGFFVCTVLSDIIAVQDKFAEPVRRNRIILFGLQPHAFLFISFFLFFKYKFVAFLCLRVSWGITCFIPSVSMTLIAKLSWSCFMLSQKPVPIRSVLPAFWIDYSIHADLLTSWRQQWKAMCAGRSQRRRMGLMCNTKHKYFSAALFSQFLMSG